MKVLLREWEAAVRYHDGRFVEVLGPGRHRMRRRRTEIERLDLRPRVVPVPGQEVLTADGLSVKVSLVARLRVADPRLAVEASQDRDAAAYAALQVAMRSVVATRPLEELISGRDALGPEVAELAAPAVLAVGLALDEVGVRDVMVPAELRRAAMDVVVARSAGQAALERARGETAALRSLANAARLAQDTPALLQLRTLQAVEAGGATVVLRSDGAPADERPAMR